MESECLVSGEVGKYVAIGTDRLGAVRRRLVAAKTEQRDQPRERSCVRLYQEHIQRLPVWNCEEQFARDMHH